MHYWDWCVTLGYTRYATGSLRYQDGGWCPGPRHHQPPCWLHLDCSANHIRYTYIYCYWHLHINFTTAAGFVHNRIECIYVICNWFKTDSFSYFLHFLREIWGFILDVVIAFMIYNQHDNTQYYHLADLLMTLYDNLSDDLLMCI